MSIAGPGPVGPDPVGPDPVGFALHAAMNGLSVRQRVVADNIANVDTPGFRATSVDFESSLQRAIDRGRVTAASPLAVEVAPTLTPVGANGNNVDLRKESIAAIQTQYQYQVVGRAISERHGLVSKAAQG
ncbi:flagellar basal body rod protein FlgB [Nocardioides sp. TF02-7]|uniref:flagellar basal body rod protein FlgB n=1 Tax=Nocardioides sp. TF02-7 TaxID=2917724 RepID=UPI001F061A07|nr:flagellar basal body rod protein FlgB [Nocardioides sp. TF02-7]UMG92957.1 flagellar basal body rod protein FlgB [Nocardioides sp. TF02-7]